MRTLKTDTVGPDARVFGVGGSSVDTVKWTVGFSKAVFRKAKLTRPDRLPLSCACVKCRPEVKYGMPTASGIYEREWSIDVFAFKGHPSLDILLPRLLLLKMRAAEHLQSTG